MKRILSVLFGFVVLISMGCGYKTQAAAQEMTFGDGYNGASLSNVENYSIQYSRREEEEVSINGKVPTYYDVSSRENTCANVAGAIVLGYYDKDYDELIENFTSARVIRGRVTYYSQTQAVLSVMEELYTLMQTNVTEGGTTVSNFKSGLQTYIVNHGRNVEFQKVVENSIMKNDVYSNAIQEEKPIVLFVSGYTLIPDNSFDTETGVDRFEKQHYDGNHMVVGYGKKIIRYYDSNGEQIEQLNLLEVATGYDHGSTGYLLLDDYGKLIDGYAVEIF